MLCFMGSLPQCWRRVKWARTSQSPPGPVSDLERHRRVGTGFKTDRMPNWSLGAERPLEVTREVHKEASFSSIQQEGFLNEVFEVYTLIYTQYKLQSRCGQTCVWHR